MKQKVFYLFSFFAISLLLSSCLFLGGVTGNGKVAEQSRTVSSFDEIKVSRGLNVYINQGESPKVVVTADENLLNLIETKVKNGVLEITASQNIRQAKSKKIFVTVSKISKIGATSGSNVYSETILESKNLELTGSAGSNIKLMLRAENLKVSASAGSNFKLEGTTAYLNAKASAGSNIKAEELTSNKSELKTSSGANIWITAKESFSGKASSGGNIFYYGNPSSLDVEKSSGGNIIKR